MQGGAGARLVVSAENKCFPLSVELAAFSRFAAFREGAPPPHVFTKTNKHAGENEQVCKIVCKNLVAKNLQIKI
jgi:hypothetical protein